MVQEKGKNELGGDMFWIALLGSLVISAIACLLHYEILHFLQTHLLKVVQWGHRKRIFCTVMVISMAHFAEILLYALGFKLAVFLGLGTLEGAVTSQPNMQDFIYYSVASYSTLGIGDVYPTAYLRWLTGVEAVVGLMLIAWSATFIYFHMEKRWMDTQR